MAHLLGFAWLPLACLIYDLHHGQAVIGKRVTHYYVDSRRLKTANGRGLHESASYYLKLLGKYIGVKQSTKCSLAYAAA